MIHDFLRIGKRAIKVTIAKETRPKLFEKYSTIQERAKAMLKKVMGSQLVESWLWS